MSQCSCVTEIFVKINFETMNNKLGQALWARSNFGLWYAAVGVVKMLHTDNKQHIRK